MAIELTCSQCGKMLRVPDDARGKKARCPECSNIFDVPSAGGESMAGGQQWHARIEDGRTYGPVDKEELDRWVAEGRITERAQLRLAAEQQWRPASEFYPRLAAAAPPAEANPFSDAASESASPYSAPQTQASAGRYPQPDRGAVVLTLGILSIFFSSCTCFVLGIAAWMLGNSDLQAMRAGRMDPRGYGTTQAGMILGIIGTVLHGLVFLCMFFGNAVP